MSPQWSALLVFVLELVTLEHVTPAAAGSKERWDDVARTTDSLHPPGLLGVLEGHKAPIYALATSPEGWLASGARDHSIGLWNLTAWRSQNVASQRATRHLDGHRAGVTALAFARDADGELIISGGADNTTRIWDLAGNQKNALPHPKTVFGIAAKPRAPRVASDVTGDSQGRANAGSRARPMTEERREGDVSQEFATACWDGVARVFSLPSGAEKAALHGHEGGLYSVAYSPLDGSLLATTSADRTVRIWDLQKMEQLWTLRGHRDHVTSVDWSPTTPFVLASGGWDRKFRMWAVNRQEVQACRMVGNCSASLAPRATAKHPQLVWRVAFAPGGELVAACHGAVGQSPTVVIYDAATVRVKRRLGRHKDTPLTVAWSSDGSLLATAGMDRKVLLYEGRVEADDMPQGDPDDAEEKSEWLADLKELRTGQRARDLVVEVLRNRTKENVSEAAIPSIPHPLAGRAAFY